MLIRKIVKACVDRSFYNAMKGPKLEVIGTQTIF